MKVVLDENQRGSTICMEQIVQPLAARRVSIMDDMNNKIVCSNFEKAVNI